MRAFAAAILVIALASPGWAAPSRKADPGAARQEIRRRLDELMDQKQTLERAIALTRREIATLNGHLAQAKKLRAESAGQAAQAKQKRLGVEQEAAALGAKIKGLTSRYKRRLRALYLYGPDASGALLASAGDFAGVLFRSQALTRLARADRKSLAQIRASRQKLAVLRGKLALEEARQDELSERMTEQREMQAALLVKQRELLTELEQNHLRLKLGIKALREAEMRLARTFALGGLPPGPNGGPTGVLAARGNLSPPVEGRLQGRAGPGGRGVVMAARPGSPVRSPWWGKVVFAGPLTGYGRVAVIDHGDRVHTVLAHLGRLSVAKGQQVAAGALLGRVDTNGRLYLEVRRGAKPQNPALWLHLTP